MLEHLPPNRVPQKSTGSHELAAPIQRYGLGRASLDSPAADHSPLEYFGDPVSA
jgi:hypothetical protein